jgi:hypothetical protein
MVQIELRERATKSRIKVDGSTVARWLPNEVEFKIKEFWCLPARNGRRAVWRGGYLYRLT